MRRPRLVKCANTPKTLGWHLFVGERLTPSNKLVSHAEGTAFRVVQVVTVKGVKNFAVQVNDTPVRLSRFRGEWWRIKFELTKEET